MFIIVEGMHDVGKTTFVNSLLKLNNSLQTFDKFEGKRIVSTPEMTERNRYFDEDLTKVKNDAISSFALGANCAISWFAERISRYDLNIVFDRLHLSEFAYSLAIRNHNYLGAIHKFNTIDARLAKTNTKLIYLTNNINVISERAKDRNKNKHFNDETNEQLLFNLDKAYKLSGLQKIKLETNKPADELVADIMDWI